MEVDQTRLARSKTRFGPISHIPICLHNRSKVPPLLPSILTKSGPRGKVAAKSGQVADAKGITVQISGKEAATSLDDVGIDCELLMGGPFSPVARVPKGKFR